MRCRCPLKRPRSEVSLSAAKETGRCPLPPPSSSVPFNRRVGPMCARAREGFSRPRNTRHRSRVLLINSMT
jgi:hypothetical protein